MRKTEIIIAGAMVVLGMTQCSKKDIARTTTGHPIVLSDTTSYPIGYDTVSSKTPTPVTQDECTQLSYWDEELYEDKETPICIECFNNIQSDGYGHHHCDSCDAWYTDNEVSMFN